MDWHELGMRERERKTAAEWGLVGLRWGGYGGWVWVSCIARPDVMPQRLLAFCRRWGGSLWTEHISKRRKNAGFRFNLHGAWWLHHIEVKPNQEYTFVWNNWRKTKCWTLNYNRNLSRMGYLNTLKGSHQMPFPLLLATAVTRAARLITPGNVVKLTSMESLSNFK